MTNKLGPISESREFLNIAKQNAKKTAPNMPQHQACLDTIEEGLVHGGYAGLLKVFKYEYFIALWSDFITKFDMIIMCVIGGWSGQCVSSIRCF